MIQDQPTGWICCQLGAREHYAVARAFHKVGKLEMLITDCWIPPGSYASKLKPSLRSRFHVDLAQANVVASNLSTVSFEICANLARLNGWRRILARNALFQNAAISQLRLIKAAPRRRVVMAYSYAALRILKYARAQGWFTVLNQIDPGPMEEKIVTELYEKDLTQRGHWNKPPPAYWQAWREECGLADRIVVNSAWSRQALIQEGIAAAKLRVIPLAYEICSAPGSFLRNYPPAFTRDRPLRILFLGQVNMRKGVGPIFDAIKLLGQEPVEFTFVGPIQVSVPPPLRYANNVHWVGPVSRENTSQFYRKADIFLFPSFSDGFGLTQLEAQSWRLPVLTTKFTGAVVEHGRNGWLLDTVSGEEIATMLRLAVNNPRELQRLSDNTEISRFGLHAVGQEWLRVLD